MEDQNERILKEMEDTRSSLTEKLEALETKVTEKVVQPVADAVDRATDAAANIVDTVKDTVHTVTEKVEETTQAVVSAFDLRRQTEKHPWLVFGLAATTGCMVGSFLGRRGRRHEAPTESGTWSRSKHHARGTNGASHHTEASPMRRAPKKAESEHATWIKEQLRQLGKLAISALMSSIRDLAKRNVPGPLGDRIGAEVENMTTSLGAEPIRGDVVGPIVERTGNGKETARSGMDTPEAVNRLRTGGSSQDLL
jgi:ElaB/YqjD/DUF883 family membrane-anchored ribosome-binding protein